MLPVMQPLLLANILQAAYRKFLLTGQNLEKCATPVKLLPRLLNFSSLYDVGVTSLLNIFIIFNQLKKYEQIVEENVYLCIVLLKRQSCLILQLASDW